jgi:dTDP-4-amino-4,6-dideoxygalactose transaminase
VIDTADGPVRFQPVLPLGTALGAGQRTGGRPFPLDEPGLVLTFSGTAAIHQAFRSLALPRGSAVLCPSYNCGHEIEPLVRQGLMVRCYRVGPGLRADLADIERRMDAGVRALLVTHYFGFPQPLAELRELCDRRGIFLVEDCAHALLSDDEHGAMGRTGDAAVYSIRKTIPVPNGGAVLLRNGAPALAGPLEQPPALTTWLKALALARKSALDRARRDGSWLGLLPVAALAPLVGGSELLERIYPATATACYDPDDDDFGFDSAILDWAISPYSAGLLERMDWSGIAARRRHNYRVLADGLRDLGGCELLLPELPERTCPLFLPLVVRRRAEVFRHLIDRRIFPAVWWDQRHPAVPWERFPEAVALKEQVLALPVHQDVDDRQLDRLLDAMRSCPVL